MICTEYGLGNRQTDVRKLNFPHRYAFAVTSTTATAAIVAILMIYLYDVIRIGIIRVFHPVGAAR